MTGNIVWLASYPKSGNTWFRAFISAILGEKICEPDINDMSTKAIASSREIFETHAGVEASELLADEIELLRPEVYSRFSRGLSAPAYIKVHDAYTRTREGNWLFPPEITRGVVYLIRNPLDVAVSFSNHASQPMERVVTHMCQETFCLNGKQNGLGPQLEQRLLTWSSHVTSWVDSPNSVCVIRFEDMKQKPVETFFRATRFLNLKKNPDDVKKAVECCRFDRLKGQEEAKGFNERPSQCTFFFRKGLIGDWRNHLSPEDRRILIEANGATMKRFGYLTDDRQPIY